MVEYQFKMGEEEQEVLVEANYRYAKRKDRKRMVIARMISAAAAVLMWGYSAYLWSNNSAFFEDSFNVSWIMGIAAIVFFIWGIYFLYVASWGYRNMMKRKIKKALMKTDEKVKAVKPVYRFCEEHIELESELSAGTVSWEAIAGRLKIGEWCVLVRRDNLFILVKETELSEEEKRELTELLQMHSIPEF